MPTADARVMTIEEANALVPALSQLVGRQMLRASEIELRLGRLRKLGGATTGKAVDIEVEPDDSPEVLELKTELASRIQEYEEGWRDVQDLGAVVKDPRVGLCDFYGRVDGKLVWLCWRYGEEAIEFYHDLDAGFSARKPLGKARERMLN